MSGRPRLTVLGVGRLGSTHAACMASLGYEVLGVDVDAAKVAELDAGRLPVFEPDLAELLRAELASRRLRFTTSFADAAAFGDVHFICTGTPQLEVGEGADLRQVHACVAALAPLLRPSALIVGKSTVPVGTARALQRDLDGLDREVEVAWNPEFLREGRAVADTLAPDRIVVGVSSRRAEEQLRELYGTQLASGSRLFVTGLETAELAKVAANAFLATKISFINAMAEVSEASGADVRALAAILGADPRIGERSLFPGLGFGGGCLPKDIRAFMAQADELGVGEALGFLREVERINLRRRSRAVDLALELVGGDVAGVAIAVLGAAFKPDSDDVRDSPALDVAQILHGLGARVTVYDPAAMANAAALRPELAYASSVEAAATGASLVLLLTEWAEFTALSPADLDAVVRHKQLVDARNVLDPAPWLAAGWVYRSLGVGERPPGGDVARPGAGTVEARPPASLGDGPGEP